MAEFTPTPKATQPTPPPVEVEAPKSISVPGPDETMEIVQAHPLVLQFKNSLKWVQGGTGVSIERMTTALDSLAAQVYLEGIKRGLEIGEGVVKHEIKKG